MIAVTGRLGSRRKELLDDLMEKTGNWKLKVQGDQNVSVHLMIVL